MLSSVLGRTPPALRSRALAGRRPPLDCPRTASTNSPLATPPLYPPSSSDLGLIRSLSHTAPVARRPPASRSLGPRKSQLRHGSPSAYLRIPQRPPGPPSAAAEEPYEYSHANLNGSSRPIIEPAAGAPSAQDVKVEMPEDPSGGVLAPTHAARVLLEQPALVVTRQIEMLNILAGFEVGNKYAICDAAGQPIGFIAEEEQGILGAVKRQALRTHRPFKAVVLDASGRPILWVRRPFQLINSKIFVHSGPEDDAPLVGEAQQVWHPWRRKYDLFLARSPGVFEQFAAIDEGLWAWGFWLRDGEGRARASVDRNWVGLAREVFTDTGTYVIRFDAVAQELASPLSPSSSTQSPSTAVIPSPPTTASPRGLTLDERAVALATAVSIDFDYFSRLSSNHGHHGGIMGGGGFFPFPVFGVGGFGAGEAVGGAPPAEFPGRGVEGPGGGLASEEEAMEGAELPSGMREPQQQQPGREMGEREWWDEDLAGGQGTEELLEDPWGASPRGDEEVWGEEEDGMWGGEDGGEGGGEGGGSGW